MVPLSCRSRELSLLLTTVLLLTYVTLERVLQERPRPLEQLLVKSNWFKKSTQSEDDLEVKSILDCGTGPDDFASMGDAVHNLTRLLNSPLLATANELAGAAFDHLFPFASQTDNAIFGSLLGYKKSTRGLVIPCGASHFNFALHLVAAVRHIFKSPLPIEIMYTANELMAEQRNALESIGPDIVTMDILNVFDESIAGLQEAGWAIKPFAILASKFEHVILVDADTVFLQSPSIVLAHPGFMSTGTLFFHDRAIGGPAGIHTWWRSIMQGRAPSLMMEQSAFWGNKTHDEMESGVVAFDKSKKGVLIALAFVAWMNTKTVREQTTYSHTYGDKESFWMAFELAKVPYHFDNVYASAIGNITQDDDGKAKLCPCQILHLDREGKPFWFNGSLYRNKYLPKAEREWLNPEVWARDTGSWQQASCMLDLDKSGGPQSFLGSDQHGVYMALIQTAVEMNIKYDNLCM